MPNKRPNVKNEKQYEGLKKKGMSKARAARIANSPGASKRGGKSAVLGAAPLKAEPLPRRRPRDGRAARPQPGSVRRGFQDGPAG